MQGIWRKFKNSRLKTADLYPKSAASAIAMNAAFGGFPEGAVTPPLFSDVRWAMSTIGQGPTSYIQASSAFGGSSTVPFEYGGRFEVESLAAETVLFVASSTSVRRLYVDTSGRLVLWRTLVRIQSAAGSVIAGVPFEWKVKNNLITGLWELYLNDMDTPVGTYDRGANSFDLNQLPGVDSANAYGFKVYNLWQTEGSFVDHWDETTASGNGTTWVSRSGTRTLTMVNAAGATGSWWTSYSASPAVTRWGSRSLESTADGRHVKIPWVTLGQTVGDYIRIKARGNMTGTYELIGANNVTMGFRCYLSNTGLGFGSTGDNFTENYVKPSIGELFEVRLTKVASNVWVAHLNGVQLGSGLVTNSNFNFDQLMMYASASAQSFKGHLYEVEISNNGGVSPTRWYDSSLYSPNSSRLRCRVSGLDGTLTNFPTDGSQWVSYNSITQTQPIPELSTTVGQQVNINLDTYFNNATGYQIYSGALPQGLSIVGNQITGTATQVGTVTCVIRAYNDYDTLDSGVVSFVIDGGSGTPFTGDILKSSLSVSNKSFLVSAGYSANTVKDTLILDDKQLSLSAGYNALAVKSSLTLSNDTLTANAGYNDDVLLLSIPLDNKPLDLSSGAILELQKNAYTVNNKQFSVTAGSSISFSGNLNKLSLNLSFKQLSASCGFNSAASSTTYPINYLPEDVEAGYSVEMLSDTLIVDGKPLTVSVGTEINFVGVLNKDSLTLSSKALSVEAGTVIPFTGDIQKQSLIISYKQLETIRGHVLDVQRNTLSLAMKALTIGETIYPIVPTERLYSMKIQNTTYVIKLKNTVHVFKDRNTIHVMKGK